jgi:hypothetical protein
MKQEFALLISEKRKEKYPSARAFCLENQLPITQQYYSKVESGFLPTLEIAKLLIETLNLDLRIGLIAWLRDHLPKASEKALFQEKLNTSSKRETNNPDPSTTLIVNRVQLKLLLKDPIYWEFLMYISDFQKHRKITLETIEKEFNLPKKATEEILKELYDNGLIETFSKNSITSKDWIFIPYNEEFADVRDQNIKRAFEQFWKIPKDERYRTTITCLVDEATVSIFEANTVSLVNELTQISSRLEKEQKKSKLFPYTVGVFASHRKFGV